MNELMVHHEKNITGYWEYNSHTGKSTSGKSAFKEMKQYAADNGYASILLIRGRNEKTINL